MKARTFILIFTFLVLSCQFMIGQVSVSNNATAPDPSAMLDVQSTDKGMLIPRMVTSQRITIVNPAEGLLVYDEETRSFWYVLNSSKGGITWKEISSSTSGWSTTGNSGTDTILNFIGTTDLMPLKFKVNNQVAGWLDPTVLANTGFGYRSLAINTSGYENTAIGYEALTHNTTGAGNTASGVGALRSNITGSDNTASGWWALYYNTEGSSNAAFGIAALRNNSTGNLNTATGCTALMMNTVGNYNTAGGYNALYSNNTGSYNTAYGSGALANNKANNRSTAVGYNAIGRADNRTAGRETFNTAVGYEALKGSSTPANNTGQYNTAMGDQALYANTSGSKNTASGYRALYSNTTGHSNTSMGHSAGYNLTSGKDNIFLGSSSGPYTPLSIDSSMWLGNTRENEPAIYGDLKLGRIGIGTTTPDPSAKLEVNSTSQGFLPPRMTQEQIEAIQFPAEGLIVYCTTDHRFYAYTGGSGTGSWRELSFGSGIITPVFTCDSLVINHVTGNVAPVSKTVNYAAVANFPIWPNLCWLTSNLGADHQADSINDPTEASAGWYWQYNKMQGYKHDGINRTPNSTWINLIDENSEWIAANDPCNLELGTGWRLPTMVEWYNMSDVLDWDNGWGPWGMLKMHFAGYLYADNGSIVYRGSLADYWSSTYVNNTTGYDLGFDLSSCGILHFQKACGLSVRCVKEILP